MAMPSRFVLVFEHESEKTDTLRRDDLDQECEMLDIPGIGIVSTKILQTRSEHDLRIEMGSSYRND